MINRGETSEGMSLPAAGGRIVKMLTPHTTAVDEWAMFASDTAPAFIGNVQPGIDWSCPRCDAILVAAAYEAQFLDVLFRCPRCGEIGASPIRQPGQPLVAALCSRPPDGTGSARRRTCESSASTTTGKRRCVASPADGVG